MRFKNLDWEDIKFFGVISECKTVRASARHMGVHHSTVSRRIDALEHAIGTKLFSRTPEGFALTKEGELLAEVAKDLADKINDAQRVISGGERSLSGTIKVSMPDPVATIVFAPYLHEFRRQHPLIEVEIVSDYGFADLSRQYADIAIRLSNNPGESLFGKKLFTYSNSAYIAKKHQNALRENNWRNCHWIGWSSKKTAEWAKGSELENIPVWGRFEDLRMQTELAVTGFGIAYLPCLVGDAHPELTRATNDPPSPSRDVWILTHSDLRNSRKIRAFMTFAETILTKYRALFEGDNARKQI